MFKYHMLDIGMYILGAEAHQKQIMAQLSVVLGKIEESGRMNGSSLRMDSSSFQQVRCVKYESNWKPSLSVKIQKVFESIT